MMPFETIAGAANAPLDIPTPTTSTSSMEKLGYHPELDGARGLAGILVIFYHYAPGLIDQWKVGTLPQLAVLARLTWSGVDLFFVLSGYLICRQLWAEADRRMPTAGFYFNRLRRIVPLYFLMIGLYMVLAATPLSSLSQLKMLFHSPIPSWSYFAFIQNYYMAARHDMGGAFLAVTWSVALEMQFYVVAPWLARLIPLRLLLPACIGGILLALFCREFGSQIQAHLLPLRPQPRFQPYLLLPWRSDGLLIGALIAGAELGGKLKEVPRRIFLPGSALAGVLFWLRGWEDPDQFRFNYLFPALFFGLLIAWLLADKKSRLASVFRMKWLCACGRISYGIYLFHIPVAFLMRWLIPGQSLALRLVVDVAVTVLLATISYEVYESRFLARRHSTKPLRSELGKPAMAC